MLTYEFDLKNDTMKDCTELNGGDETLGRPCERCPLSVQLGNIPPSHHYSHHWAALPGPTDIYPPPAQSEIL